MAQPSVAGSPPPATSGPSADGLAARLGTMAYALPLRRYQALALDAFERARAAGARRSYLVLPPGGGKTVLGLEVARRLGHPTVILGPNTAIQAQWLRQWGGFVPAAVEAGADPDLSAPVTALTYQAVCYLDSRSAELDELGGWRPTTEAPGGATDRRREAAERARRRRLIARGGDADQVLGLLHPNGRALLDRIRALGPSTLILDECHHLLEMWGALLAAVLDELGDDTFVVGLTATPPDDMDPREAELYGRIFGPPDYSVPTPALVKEGDLAPYQELAIVTEPLPAEAQYIETQERRFQELITALLDPALATLPFISWLQQRIVRHDTAQGAPIAWVELRRTQPELAIAALRLLSSRGLPLPEGAVLGEAERREPTADDWAALLGAYCSESLGRSSAAIDRAAWEQIRAALPPLGYVLTLDGVRRHASPVDRVLSLSASKFVAALTILSAESAQLGPELRALLLCDYETMGVTAGARLRGVLDPDAGSAALLLQVLLGDPLARTLQPILVTGRTVACSAATAQAFRTWAAAEVPELHAAFGPEEGSTKAGGPADATVIDPATSWWRPRNYVPLVTRYFETGRAHCLVGTRGLLGEGWDAHRVNVLVDLTTAATITSVSQIRGRSLRLDAAAPHKVADNWDVVCVMPDHAKGGSDYARFVRKHRSYFGLTATGEVESGVSHVDARFSPFGPPPREQFGGICTGMLGRASRRDETYSAWRIGQPYQDRNVPTVRVLPSHSAPRAGTDEPTPTASLDDATRREAKLRVGTSLVSSGIIAAGGIIAGEPLIGITVAGGTFAAGSAWSAGPLRDACRRMLPRETLDDLTAALLSALRHIGAVPENTGLEGLRLVPQPDGYYRCYLTDVPAPAAAAFTEALAELIGPLAMPRYLAPRAVVPRPIGLTSGVRLAVRRTLRLTLSPQVAYHAVPAVFSGSRARLEPFATAWRRLVSPGAIVSTREPLGAGLLELHRGEEPYARETQVRTLWY